MTAPAHEKPVGVSAIELFFDLVFVFVLSGGMALFMLGDVFFRWVMGMRPIAVHSLGAATALVLGFLGTRWGTRAALAAVAALAIAAIAIEQQLESRKA